MRSRNDRAAAASESPRSNGGTTTSIGVATMPSAASPSSVPTESSLSERKLSREMGFPGSHSPTIRLHAAERIGQRHDPAALADQLGRPAHELAERDDARTEQLVDVPPRAGARSRARMLRRRRRRRPARTSHARARAAAPASCAADWRSGRRGRRRDRTSPTAGRSSMRGASSSRALRLRRAS